MLTLIEKLNEANIETRPLWKPMHLQPVYKDAPAYVNGVSEELFRSGLCLPSGPCVGEEQIEYIVKKIQVNSCKVKLCSGINRLAMNDYSTLAFNLTTLSFILFVVFLNVLFNRKKHQKLPAQSKNSRNVLRNVDNTALSHPVRCKLRLHCARLYAGGIVDLQANSCHVVSTQPNIACRLSLFVSVQALRDLCGLALLKNITLPHFKHILAYS